MEIRAEQPDDIDAIRAVQTEAFRREPDVVPSEAPLVDALRADPAAWIEELSLVAIDGGRRVIGHVVCSRAWVGEGRHPALGLGPIGVLPPHQAEGVGSALMRRVIEAANARGEPLIALLGNPAYYSRFGFVRSTDHGIDPPDAAWGEFFQVLPLATHEPAVTGTFRYTAAFD